MLKLRSKSFQNSGSPSFLKDSVDRFYLSCSELSHNVGTGKEARVIFYRLNIYGYTVSMGAFVRDDKK